MQYSTLAMQEPKNMHVHAGTEEYASPLRFAQAASLRSPRLIADLVLPVLIFQVRPIRLAEPTAGRQDIAMLEGAALPLILDAVLTRRRLLLLTGLF